MQLTHDDKLKLIARTKDFITHDLLRADLYEDQGNTRMAELFRSSAAKKMETLKRAEVAMAHGDENDDEYLGLPSAKASQGGLGGTVEAPTQHGAVRKGHGRLGVPSTDSWLRKNAQHSHPRLRGNPEGDRRRAG